MNEYLFQLLPYGITTAYGNNEEQARKYFENNDLNRLNHIIHKVLAVRDTESGIWIKQQKSSPERLPYVFFERLKEELVIYRME